MQLIREALCIVCVSLILTPHYSVAILKTSTATTVPPTSGNTSPITSATTTVTDTTTTSPSTTTTTTETTTVTSPTTLSSTTTTLTTQSTTTSATTTTELSTTTTTTSTPSTVTFVTTTTTAPPTTTQVTTTARTTVKCTRSTSISGSHSGRRTPTPIKVKIDFDIRRVAAVNGKFNGAFLSNNKIYLLSNAKLNVYSLTGGKSLMLDKTVNLPTALDARDLVLSKDGSELYVADYKSKSIVAFTIPTANTVSLNAKYVRCQLKSCRPTSLSLDSQTNDLYIGCSDDNKLMICSASGLTKEVAVPSSVTRLVHAISLSSAQQYGVLVQQLPKTLSGTYAVCIGTIGSSVFNCPYKTSLLTKPSYLSATPNGMLVVMDQSSNDSLFVYGPGLESGMRVATNTKLISPSIIKIDYYRGQFVVIDQQGFTVFNAVQKN